MVIFDYLQSLSLKDKIKSFYYNNHTSGLDKFCDDVNKFLESTDYHSVVKIKFEFPKNGSIIVWIHYKVIYDPTLKSPEKSAE